MKILYFLGKLFKKLNCWVLLVLLITIFKTAYIKKQVLFKLATSILDKKLYPLQKNIM